MLKRLPSRLKPQYKYSSCPRASLHVLARGQPATHHSHRVPLSRLPSSSHFLTLPSFFSTSAFRMVCCKLSPAAFVFVLFLEMKKPIDTQLLKCSDWPNQDRTRCFWRDWGAFGQVLGSSDTEVLCISSNLN
jgi:hypothetical protein